MTFDKRQIGSKSIRERSHTGDGAEPVEASISIPFGQHTRVTLTTSYVEKKNLLLMIAATFTALFVAIFPLPKLTITFEEVAAFIDSVGLLIIEDDVYDSIFTRVSRPEDKLRLSKIHRDIQESRHDLSVYLNNHSYVKGNRVFQTSPRFLWTIYKKQLEKRARRLNRLHTRFLFEYMDICMPTAGHSDVFQQSRPETSNKDKAV
ncbi:hypothetical protein F4814DRAFT_456731 [Daldinia grandis]|nr:hypothetical protein F4814DRAFT_456731 [Daldinia grandis]